MERGIVLTRSRSFLQVKNLQSSGAITIKPSGDTDDYFTLTTAGDIPTITATGATHLAFGSDISIGSNSLKTTNLFLYQADANTLNLRDSVGGTFKDLQLNELNGGLYQSANGGSILKSRSATDGYGIMTAYDTGVGTREIARMVGNADPYFHIGYGSGTTPLGVGIRTIEVSCDHATHGMFNAAGLTDNAVVWQQPAASVLLGIRMLLTEQFAAASLTDLDITLGQSGGDEDGWLVQAMNLTSDAVATQYKTRGALWDTSAEGVFWYAPTANDIYGFATAVGANLNTLSAGTVTFYFTYLDLP